MPCFWPQIRLQFAFSHNFYNEICEDFRLLYSRTLKGNSFIAFSVLTGVTRIAKVNLFSGLNNIRASGVLEEEFDSLFGFTYSETKAILKDFRASEEWKKFLKKDYVQELYSHQADPIYAYGICFQGQKSCTVSKKLK